jgi:ElaB/YqjD/DUF883 family membrane-anchored ribosome-binding protein
MRSVEAMSDQKSTGRAAEAGESRTGGRSSETGEPKATGRPAEAASDIAADLAALKADLTRLAESVAALVGEEGASAAAAARHKAREARRSAEAAASRLTEEGMAAIDETRARFASLGDDVAGVVERNPLAALVSALGLGILIGMMSRRRD